MTPTEAQGTALGAALKQGQWELAALALLIAATGALDSLPPQAASGLVEALSDGEIWHPEKSRPRKKGPFGRLRTGHRGTGGSTPGR
ncbi:MAG: hypothetical protein V3U31_07750 [Dehalococcoidia bacterium]